VEGAIEYWPLVFRSLWFVAINFYDAFFFLSSHLSLEGSSLQVHIPYAKSYRIFPFLKFVCFRNMNYVYANVNLKYIWMCQSVVPQMKPTFPPAGGLLTLLVILLYSSICLKYIWLEYYCQILRILIRLCMKEQELCSNVLKWEIFILCHQGDTRGHDDFDDVAGPRVE